MRALLLLLFLVIEIATAALPPFPRLRRSTQELREYAAARGIIADEVAHPRTYD